MKKILLASILMSILAMPFLAYAQDYPDDVPDMGFWEALSSIMSFVFGLLLFLAVLVLIAAGILFVTAAGDPEKAKKARTMITYALVGVVVALLARGAVAIIEETLGG